MSTIISNFNHLHLYLNGSRFSENHMINYSNHEQVPHRIDFIRDICKSKRVLHIGCTDHPPLIAEKIAAKEWLHGVITDCASFTLGVDIDAEAVAKAKKFLVYKTW